LQQCSATIIPLVPASRPGSSDLPEGSSFPTACATVKGVRSLSRMHSSSRASSPLLFGLAPRGVCHALDITAEAVGSYPTFSPLPTSRTFEDVPKVFLRAITGLRAAGGIVSVALSVNSSTGFSLCLLLRQHIPHAHRRSFTDSSLCYRSPGVTRRIALLCSRRVVSGLSSRPVRLRVPGQRSSSSPANSIISRDPPLSSGLLPWRNVIISPQAASRIRLPSAQSLPIPSPCRTSTPDPSPQPRNPSCC
jgi:hypothetical protein